MKTQISLEKITSTRSASNRRQLTRIASVIVLGVLALGLGDLANALIGNGFTVWQWGTTKDQTGLNIGSASNRTCFLSGVAGNLNVGGEWYEDIPSVALVGKSADYWLVAHGGAYTNQVNQPVWKNNPVNAQATCFWTATNVQSSYWGGFNGGKAPKKIAELSTGNTNVRQCFLSALQGVAGSWNNSGNFARVVKQTVVDATHPTTGWYVEANLPNTPNNSPGAGSHPSVGASCVEFPQGTIISTGSVSAPANATKTTAITSGAGVKACALTSIVGAWNVNNWTDGAMMSFPAKIDGNWSLTVKNGKTADWACAR